MVRKPTLVLASAALLVTTVASAVTKPAPPIYPGPKPCASSPTSKKACPGPWLPPVPAPPKK
jgi:hypothetical protein